MKVNFGILAKRSTISRLGKIILRISYGENSTPGGNATVRDE